MDKSNQYRVVIQRILTQHAAQKSSIGQIETLALFDEHNDNYLVMDVGWDRTGRVHSVFLHLHIKNGKVWVEVDGTERGVAEELLGAGIPKEDIVLAFYRPERRQLTEFAVA